MKLVLRVLLYTLGASALAADEVPKFAITKPLSLWDQAYGEKPANKVYLYRDTKNPYIQGVNFLFRGQLQYGAIDANQGSQHGSNGHTWEWRRFTLGGGIDFLQDFHFVNVWSIGGMNSMGYAQNGIWHDHRQTNGSLSEIYIDYKHTGVPSIRVGKQFPHFFAENRHIGSDYSMPELPALEAQLSTSSVYGIKVSEESADKILNWGAGVWSNTDERSRGTWPTFQSVGTLLNISPRIDDVILKKGRLYFDWVYATQSMDNMATAEFRDNYTGARARSSLAVYYVGSEGPVDLVVEALWANKLASYKQGSEIVRPDNVYGIMVMPMYMLTKNIQLVGRYQWSKGRDAVKLNPRYESLARSNGQYVDEYHAIALGLNYFVYPEKHNRLKIMTLVEYVNTNKRHATGGFTGWAFIGGIYTNF